MPCNTYQQFIFLSVYSGLIDPMTGEGIHTAMDSGRMAADVLDEAFKAGNFDAAVLEEYQNRWMNSFGIDFYWYNMIISPLSTAWCNSDVIAYKISIPRFFFLWLHAEELLWMGLGQLVYCTPHLH